MTPSSNSAGSLELDPLDFQCRKKRLAWSCFCGCHPFLGVPGKPGCTIFLRQLWLVFGVKLMEINSNLFSGYLFFSGGPNMQVLCRFGLKARFIKEFFGDQVLVAGSH